MESLFVGYNEAKQLSELSFSEECFAGYLKKEKTLWIGYVSSEGGEQFNRNYHFLAPTFYQAFRWFREKYDLYYTIEGSKKYGFAFFIYYENDDKDELKSKEYSTYEEAEQECLKKLIEIVKQK